MRLKRTAEKRNPSKLSASTVSNMASVCSVCLSSSVSVASIFNENLLSSSTEPLLVDMIMDCFNFNVNGDDKNICDSCTADVQAAYRFKRNYERNIMVKEKEIDDIIDSLSRENWELINNTIKSEPEDENSMDENKTQNEINDNESSNKTNTDDDKTVTETLTLPNETSHVQSKAKSFVCTECDRVFKRNWDLQRHQRLHSGERPYNCIHCDKSFAYSWVLKCHQAVHTGERQFECANCSKTFTRRDQLQVHLRSHTGERPYSCSQCQKCFTKLDNLKMHQRVHTGERPYLCAFCPKSFSQQAALKKHSLLHKDEVI